MEQILATHDMAIRCEDDIALVRRKVKDIAKARGFDAFAVAAVTTATSEMCRNTWVHGKGGTARIEEVTDGARIGIRCRFEDHGPGIADLARAMAGGFSTARSLGLGLSGTRRLVDQFRNRLRAGKRHARHDGEMGPLLTSWLAGAEAITVRDEASVSEVRQRIRTLAAEVGLPKVAAEELVLAASELGHNQLRHAREGSVGLRVIARDGTPGIELIAADAGAGIADPERAFRGDSAKAGSLGVGLAAALRQADEMDFDVRLGEGTAAWARKFAGPVESRPLVGIFGRAIPGEARMGDAAMFTRDGDALTLALIDGVGHGPEARAAALTAAGVARAEAHRGPEAAVRACDEALAEGRGAVMTVARIDGGSMELASVGNVVTRLCRPRSSQSFRGESRVLGQRGARRKITVDRVAVQSGDVVMLFTDGLKSNATVAEELALMREHPLLMAHHLFTNYARGHDDALVAAIRL